MFSFSNFKITYYYEKKMKCPFKHLSSTLTVKANPSRVISFFFPLKLAFSFKWYVMGAWSGINSRLPSSSTKEL